MMKKIAAFVAALLVGSAVPALAGSSPGWVTGYVPTAAEWNTAFQAHEDELGYTPVNRAGDTMTGRLVAVTPTSGTASINFPPGATPSSPRDGDMWSTSAGFFIQVGGVTIGPLGGGGSGSVFSVFGRAGAVLAATNDYNFSQIGGTAAIGQLPTGTSGSTVPTNTGGFTQSGVVVFSNTVALNGKATVAASGVGGAFFNLAPGIAPSSPVNGDMWATSAGLFVQINGGTIGPLAAGGGGSGCVPSGTNGNVLTSNGSGACVANTAFNYTGGNAQLGAPGSIIGSLELFNLTSGSTKLQPVAGALGSSVVSIPAATDTMALLVATQTIANKTLTSPTINAGALSGTFTGSPTFSGNPIFSGAPTFTGTSPSGSAITSLFASPPAIGGTTPAALAATTGLFTGKVSTATPTTSFASVNLPPGVAPTSPVNGDMWTTTAGLFVQAGGSTVGPLLATAPVVSVFGRTNAVTAQSGDYNFAQIGGSAAIGQLPTGTSGSTIPTNSGGFTQSGVVAFSNTVAFNAKATAAASTTGGAFFNLAPGVAPTSPANGDIWTTSTGIFVQINGGTVGPLGSGGGSGCSTGGTANQVVTTNGSGGCSSDASFTYAAGAAQLGNPGVVAGSLAFGNATSGTVKLQAVAGALGSSVLSIPAATDTLALLNATQTLAAKTLTSPTINAGALSGTFTGSPTLSGNPVFTGGNIQFGVSGTTVGSLELFNATSGSTKLAPATGALGSAVITIPGATDTMALLSATQTLASKTLTSPTINGAALSGSFTGNPTFSGNPVFSGAPTFTGTAPSGTAITALFASPPAIGGTAPSTAAFTTGSYTGKVALAAGTTSNASANIPQGSAPTSPNNGDVWVTTAGMFVRANGVTIGPFSSSGGSLTLTDGTTTVAGTTNLTVSGMVVSGSTPNATLAPTVSDLTHTTTNCTPTQIGGQDNCAGGLTTATIPGTGTLGNGQSIFFTNQNSNTVTLTNSQTVNGLALATKLHSFGFYGYVGNATSADAFGFPGYDTITAGQHVKFADASGAFTASAFAESGTQVTSTLPIVLPAGTTSLASLNIPQGAAPTSPVNGDIWTTSSGLFVRIAGSTVGPLGAGGGGSAFNSLTSGTNTTAAMVVGSGATLNALSGTFGLNGSSSGNVAFAVPAAAGSNTATFPANTGTLAEINLAQAWSAAQTYGSGFLKLSGSSSGTATLNAPAVAATNVYTLPANAGTLFGSGDSATIVGSNLSGTIALPNGATATTQAAGSNDGKVATDQYVDALIATNKTLTASWRSAVSTPTISTATFTPNFDTGQDFIINLTSACPCTIANPSTTPVAGQHGIIYIVQDGTGSRTVGTYGTLYFTAGGMSSITLSTAASAIDVVSYTVKDPTHVVVSPIELNVTH